MLVEKWGEEKKTGDLLLDELLKLEERDKKLFGKEVKT